MDKRTDSGAGDLGIAGPDGVKKNMKVSLLTGGKDPHYALGLLSGMRKRNIRIDFIGNSEMQHSPYVRVDSVAYYNLRGEQATEVSFRKKVFRVLRYYLKLLSYVRNTDSKIFHILWFNKFDLIDKVFLNIYYKLLGKKILLTAHNVDEHVRDEQSNFYNRSILRVMYKLIDHIFVHTEKMKRQLKEQFNVKENNITVVPFGMNSVIPDTSVSRSDARAKFNLGRSEKVLLFFGNIAPYKGLEFLLLSLADLKNDCEDIRLIIAGRIKNCQAYWKKIETIIEQYELERYVIRKPEYISDEEVEFYIKAADVLVLPYKYIYQSGVIFLAYKFGLPVIVTDVGALRDDVIEGKTGFVCSPEDPVDLKDTINKYYLSDLYKNLDENRKFIMDYAHDKHSWSTVAEITCKVYGQLATEIEGEVQRGS